MNSCTFFGHKDTPNEVASVLQTVLTDLIENKHVDSFYVGNTGNFDRMVRRNLKFLKSLYPHIEYAVVLAYMPNKKGGFEYPCDSDSIYPDGLENTPPKYAIVRRNRWMIDKSDYVVTYVRYTFGGAAQFKKLAERKGKTVINIADLN